MAFSPGFIATMSVNGTDISAFTKSVKFNPARKDYELAVLGGNTVKRMVGPVATTIDLDGLVDPTVTSVFTTRMAETTPTAVAFTYHPAGASGPNRSGNCFVSKYDENTTSEGPATWTAQLVVDGTVTFG